MAKGRQNNNVTLDEVYEILAGDKFGQRDGVVKQLRQIKEAQAADKKAREELMTTLLVVQKKVEIIENRPTFFKLMKAVGSAFLTAKTVT